MIESKLLLFAEREWNKVKFGIGVKLSRAPLRCRDVLNQVDQIVQVSLAGANAGDGGAARHRLRRHFRGFSLIGAGDNFRAFAAHSVS